MTTSAFYLDWRADRVRAEGRRRRYRVILLITLLVIFGAMAAGYFFPQGLNWVVWAWYTSLGGLFTTP